jgi:hypothetical protein
MSLYVWTIEPSFSAENFWRAALIIMGTRIFRREIVKGVHRTAAALLK